MDARVAFPQTTLSAVGRGRHLPRRWTGDRVTAVFTLALAFPFAAAAYETGGAILPLLVAALLVAIAWTLLFTRLRAKDMNWHAVPTAIVFALMAPPGVPLWQALLALSFGVVAGEQVFGGRGYSFLHPAVAALAFLFFSFPATTGEQAESRLVMAAALPGALLLLSSGLISWRILVSTAIGFSGWIALTGFGAPPGAMLTPALVLGAVYLVCDPTSAAATNPGRWAHGLLVGVLIALLGQAGPGVGATAAVVFAALLGSVFAPMIDRIVIHVNVARRRRRQWPA